MLCLILASLSVESWSSSGDMPINLSAYIPHPQLGFYKRCGRLNGRLYNNFLRIGVFYSVETNAPILNGSAGTAKYANFTILDPCTTNRTARTSNMAPACVVPSDIHLGLYKDVVIFDNVSKIVYAVHWVQLEDGESLEAAYAEGREKLKKLVEKLEDTRSLPQIENARVNMSLVSISLALLVLESESPRCWRDSDPYHSLPATPLVC